MISVIEKHSPGHEMTLEAGGERYDRVFQEFAEARIDNRHLFGKITGPQYGGLGLVGYSKWPTGAGL